MRIESVEAHAFGPFVDRTLQLAPGMTVVAGPNEAGKSSWHAALYALVCGMRRGAGQRKEDKEFAERHHPWEGERWEVSGVVSLVDGRRVRLHDDLAGRVNCSALDADLGRDYSQEIIDEGAPNAARWLGLDRRSFLSTACVRQADILAVTADADALQEHLQRAAATAGADATAASALSALVNYRREHIGLDRANSTKPLRGALNGLRAAQTALASATAAHTDYLRRGEEIEDRGRECERTAGERRLYEAAWERAEAGSLAQHVARARELAEKHPEEPPKEVDNSALAESVATALDAWDRKPIVEPLTGRGTGDLQADLNRLPSAPAGDIAPAPRVLDAKDALGNAASILEAHERQRPATSAAVESGGLGRDELRQLAQELSLAVPASDPGIDERLAAAQKRLEGASGPPNRLRSVLLSAVLAVAGVVAFVVAPLAVGVVLLVVAALVLGLGQRDTGAAARATALQQLRDAESEAGAQRFAAESAAKRRHEATRQVNERGLPADAKSLLDLAQRVEDHQRQDQEEARWIALRAQFQEAARNAEAQLAAALSERGITAAGDAAVAFAQYERECVARAALATEAARRPQLERALADRARLEREHDERVAERAAAEERVVRAGRVASVPDDSPDAIVPGLQDWQRIQVESMRAREAARKDWYELEGLLGGGTLADLETAAEQRASRAAEAAAGLDLGAVRSVVLGTEPEARLTNLREADVSAQTALANAQGALDLYQRDMPSVAEAEEEVARCEAERARVQALDRVLAQTTGFLERAQEDVHRDLAPVLKATLREWLPGVTSGRYVDAVVDPATLAVRVQAVGRPMREARLLSHGTAEQIYLLLRMAMATHLTLPGEVCPLLLDDVTVECDSVRRRAVLGVLHTMSRDRQVVLFSQEAEVLAWAREHLGSPQDGITELDPLLVPA
jgi:hypothetical protein